MSDSKKAYAEMQEEKEYEVAKYVFVLDFNVGKVYRYDISALCNEED